MGLHLSQHQNVNILHCLQQQKQQLIHTKITPINDQVLNWSTLNHPWMLKYSLKEFLKVFLKIAHVSQSLNNNQNLNQP